MQCHQPAALHGCYYGYFRVRVQSGPGPPPDVRCSNQTHKKRQRSMHALHGAKISKQLLVPEKLTRARLSSSNHTAAPVQLSSSLLGMSQRQGHFHPCNATTEQEIDPVPSFFSSRGHSTCLHCFFSDFLASALLQHFHSPTIICSTRLREERHILGHMMNAS